ncbi:MAG TPA: metalloregulator ArsR/SmtB family transcription factor [Bdellovibrionales bacterium]|nr:metalloregulator ArsR/SmtB family transcription factor [Bdellovibrionales bacterium]
MYQSKVEATDIFQALAEKTRLRIMRIMVAHPRAEACLCDMTDSLLEPEHNVSRHLKILRQVGLLSAYKEGRWVYHQLVNSSHIKPFYKLIAKIPDGEGIFAADLKRFNQELSKRAAARCIKDGPRFKGEKAKSGEA